MTDRAEPTEREWLEGLQPTYEAERQVGERLSEQAREEWEALDSMSFHGGIPSGMWYADITRADVWRIRDLIRDQARQLAEAERENGRLRKALRQQLIYAARMSDSRDPEGWADQQLAAFDPPASPAEGSEAATEVEGDRG